MEGKHEIICCGAKVKINNGNIEVLTEPRVTRCPLHRKGKLISRDGIKKDIEKRIKKFGFFQKNRIFDPAIIVPFGASEIVKTCLQWGLLECSVTVCDGAGTVITDNSALIQEIGARMSGVVKTSPVPGIIDSIKSRHGIVLNEKTAEIDQLDGVKKAVALGFKKIAVSVASFQAKSIEEIRDFEKTAKVEVTIFSVCNTCADEDDARFLSETDAVWACASEIVRKKIGPCALMQIGVGIPVFILTQRGKELALAYLENFNGNLVIFRQKRMPYLVKSREPRLNF